MKFNIGFDNKDLPQLKDYWNDIITTKKWSEGPYTQLFEEKWAEHNELKSIAFSSWSGAALAAMKYFNLKGKKVLCPSNTFMATPLVILNAGSKLEFVDCNRDDLCLSYDNFVMKAESCKPAAVWVVHIGGHIAFEIDKISEYCKQKGIVLLEDCAHAHGADWNGRKPGSWGDAGVYSFYATKTISTGEGGMLVTNNKDLEEYGRKYRNYGKFDYNVEGLNFRMNEFTAAIGVVQVDRLKEIVTFKNEYAEKLNLKFGDRVKLPDGMTSGYYKYIVFEPIEKSTGKVYDEQCHNILNHNVVLPNSEWVPDNHWCVPIYYS